MEIYVHGLDKLSRAHLLINKCYSVLWNLFVFLLVGKWEESNLKAPRVSAQTFY